MEDLMDVKKKKRSTIRFFSAHKNSAANSAIWFDFGSTVAGQGKLTADAFETENALAVSKTQKSLFTERKTVYKTGKCTISHALV